MRYLLSAILGVIFTLGLSIPLQQLMRMKEAEALSLRAQTGILNARGSNVMNVNVPPLKGVSSNPKEPRIKFLPQYPSDAAAKQIEGFVTLSFKVNKDGTVEDLRVIESQPASVFDQAARRAVSRWNFGSTIPEGQGQQRLRLNFNLKKNLASLEGSESR